MLENMNIVFPKRKRPDDESGIWVAGFPASFANELIGVEPNDTYKQTDHLGMLHVLFESYTNTSSSQNSQGCWHKAES